MAQWLATASPAILEQIAAHPFHREELAAGAQLSDCLTDETSLRRIFGKLSMLEQETLIALSQTFGLTLFTWCDVSKLPLHRSIAEWKAAVAKLCEKGLLCVWQKSWGEVQFSISAEAFAVWSKQVTGDWDRLREDWSSEELAYCCGERTNVILDLLLLVRFLQTNGMTRSKQHRWNKKACKKLEELLCISSFDWSQCTQRSSLIHEESGLCMSIAFVMDVASRLGLLYWKENHLSVDPSAWQLFLEGTGVERAKEVCEKWLLWHMPETIWQQHASMAIHRLPDTSWYEVSKLYDSLRQAACLPEQWTWDSFVADLESDILAPLAAFGFIHLAKLRNGRLLLRKAEHFVSAEEERSKPFLSEQGEVMLPWTRPLHEHWELLHMAERVDSLVAAPIYRMSRTSVLRGMERGTSALQLLHRLTIDVPDCFQQQLQEWEDGFGQIEVHTRTVIYCKHKHLATQLEQWLELQTWVSETGDGFLILLPDVAHAELDKLLAGTGFHVAWKNKDPEKLVNSEKWERLSPIIAKNEYLQALKPAEKLPTLPDLYERMNAIPPGWLQQFRRYHPSTGRQMMEHAIRYRSCVRLGMQGKEINFYPERVRGDRSGWIVEGWVPAGDQVREVMQFSPKEWEELLLILPGINDNNEILRS